MDSTAENRSSVAPEQTPTPIPHNRKSTDWGQTNRSTITIIDDGEARFQVERSALIEFSSERGMKDRTVLINGLNSNMLNVVISAAPSTSLTNPDPGWLTIVAAWAEPEASDYLPQIPVSPPRLELVPRVSKISKRLLRSRNSTPPRNTYIPGTRHTDPSSPPLDSAVDTPSKDDDSRSRKTFHSARSNPSSHQSYHSAYDDIFNASGDEICYKPTSEPVFAHP
jgi:hypothetical protein